MTQRDQKTLLIILVSLGGALVAFLVLQRLFLTPLGNYDRQIEALDMDIDAKKNKENEILRERKLLELAKSRSLPADPTKALAEYSKYLHTIFENQGSGMTAVQIKAQSTPADLKPAVSNTPNAPKKAGHMVLTYAVNGKGSLASIVKALESLERTPVQHRIKNLTIGRQDGGAKDAPKDMLTVQFTLEAMIVAGAKSGKEPVLEPSSDVMLPTPKNPRQYKDILAHNIFIGPEPPKDRIPDPTKLTALESRIPEFVILEFIEANGREAYLYSRLLGAEIKLRMQAGYDTFRIMNENRKKEIVKAKVLRIDQRDVYFQVREDVYGIHIGQSIADAMSLPLSTRQLTELDLKSLMVPDFGGGPEKTKTPTKTSKKR
jgi:hypothetical protein